MDKLYDVNDNYYYVYEHWLNGEVIYVGKGKGDRAFHNKRNELWNDKVKGNFKFLEVKIRGYFKEEQDAFDYEEMLINKYTSNGIKLTNIMHNPNQKEHKLYYLSKQSSNSSNSEKDEKFEHSTGFNHYKQALSFFKSRHNTIVMFVKYKNDNLIKYFNKNKEFKPLFLSSIKSNESNAIWNILKKGDIPTSYNILIVDINKLDSYKFRIKGWNIKAVIVNATDIHDQNKALNMIEGNFEWFAYKTTNENVRIKNKELTVPPRYLNRPITVRERKDIIEFLDVIGSDGKLVSWSTFKKIINNNVFQEIADCKANINGKLTQVSIISNKL